MSLFWMLSLHTTVSMWTSEGNSEELVLFYPVNPRDGTQTTSLESKTFTHFLVSLVLVSFFFMAE